MNIYTALKKDHQKIENLLNQLVESSEQGTDAWRKLATEIRDELIPHSRAEEALFYNPIRDTEHGAEVISHSYAEHALAETELRALQAMEVINANWTALAKKLREDLLHHVEEEEGKVFSAAKLVFNEEEAEQIGEAFEQLKPMVKDQSLAGTSMDFIKNILPKRFRNSLKSEPKKSA